MVVDSCEEAVLTVEPAEVVCRKIERSLAELEKVFRGKKPTRENAWAWVDSADKEINRAMCLLKLREQYPEQYAELKTIFAELDESIQRADEELFRYGTNVKHPHYVC